MKNIGIIGVLIISLSNSYAQKVTTKEVLSSLTNDERFQYNRMMTNFAQGLKYHVPLIKKIEGRFGINGNANGDTLYGNIRNEDFYGIVVGANSLREIKKQRLVKTAQVGVLEAESQINIQQALFERYTTLSAWSFAQQLLGKRSNLVQLLEKKHNILKEMLDKGLDIKVKEVMDTEGDKNSLQLALLDLENSMRLNLGKISQYLVRDSISTLDLDNFINVSKISDIIQRYQNNTSLNPIIEYKNAQNKLAFANFDLENAQNRQIFSFVQLAYQNPILQLEAPNKQKSVNNFSLRFGVTVPLPGNNNFKKSETALEQREAQYNYEITTRLNKKAIDIQLIKLENLLKQYQLCNERIEQSLIKKMLKNDKLLLQLMPLEVVDLQINQQKLEVRAIEIAQEITNEYLRLLDFNGALSARPLKNYLSMGLEEF